MEEETVKFPSSSSKKRESDVKASSAHETVVDVLDLGTMSPAETQENGVYQNHDDFLGSETEPQPTAQEPTTPTTGDLLDFSSTTSATNDADKTNGTTLAETDLLESAATTGEMSQSASSSPVVEDTADSLPTQAADGTDGLSSELTANDENTDTGVSPTEPQNTELTKIQSDSERCSTEGDTPVEAASATSDQLMSNDIPKVQNNAEEAQPEVDDAITNGDSAQEQADVPNHSINAEADASVAEKTVEEEIPAAATPKSETTTTQDSSPTNAPVTDRDSMKTDNDAVAEAGNPAREGNDPEAVSPQMASAEQDSSPASSVEINNEKEARETTNPETNFASSEESSEPHYVRKISFLEVELAKAQSVIESMQQQRESNASSEDGTSLLMELQSNLQQQMSLKAEAENRARLALSKIQQLEETNKEQAAEIEKFHALQDNLEQQMNAKAEAENNARLAFERIQSLESENGESSSQVESLQKELIQLREEKALQEEELQKIREQRDDQGRKEMALTNRLNAAKKKEADKANLAEQFEEDIKAAEQQAQDALKELEEATTAKEAIEKELEQLKKSSHERVHKAEAALADERKLNEERKRRMKAFVENKAEELRQSKAEAESAQQELNQTNKSLMDLNNRWKQLHAQWVQSQTRNRELQRDLNKIKKDSESLHKFGDTLEMKLSRSATETEEHKNKRLAAKHELMTVLRTLEAERELSARLRDSMKFTFTPKALSQQQLLKENLEDFETQLARLSQRLGKPLLPSSEGMNEMSEETPDSTVEEEGTEEKASQSDADVQRLISKLEHETQRVSQCIMAFASGIERMHVVLDASGERSCIAALGEILSRGTTATATAISSPEETTAMTGERPRVLSAIRSHSYGQVPTSTAHH